MRIFVAHDWKKEKEVNNKIMNLMEKAGFEVSIEPKKYHLEAIELKLARSILECEGFCAILLPEEGSVISRWIQLELSIAERYRVPSFLFVDGTQMGYGTVKASIEKIHDDLNSPGEWCEFTKNSLLSGDKDDYYIDILRKVKDFISKEYPKVKPLMEFGLALELALHSKNVTPFPKVLNIIGDAFDQDPNLVYDATAQAMREITGARFGFVGILEKKEKDWTQVIIKGFRGEYEIDRVELNKLKLGFDEHGSTEGITGKVAYTGKVILEGNIHRNLTKLIEQGIKFVDPGKLGIESELCVPIMLKKKAVGVLDVEDTAIEKFNEGHRMLLEWLARVISIAYSSEQLESFILNLSRVGTIKKEWLEHLLNSLMSWSRADYGFIATLNRKKKNCSVRAIEHRGLKTEISKSIAKMDILRKAGLTKQVMESGEPIYADDVSEYPNYVEFWPDVSSEIVLPIKCGGQHPIGIVDLEFKNPQNFDHIDKKLYESLANLVLIRIS